MNWIRTDMTFTIRIEPRMWSDAARGSLPQSNNVKKVTLETEPSVLALLQ